MPRSRDAVVVFSLACSVLACSARTSPPAGGPTPAAPRVTTGAGRGAPARHTHENLNAVLWMQQAVEYRIACEGTYARALDLLRAGMDRARADRTWSAAVEQQGGDYSSLPPAVVMDLDETVLDNSPAQARGVLSDEVEFDAKAWDAWVESRRAGGVPGAIHFVQQARSMAKVIFVTNRTAAEEPATLENLGALGLPTEGSDVLTLGEAGPNGGRWTSDKTARRTLLATKYRILLLVGDDLGDFISVTGKGLEARAAAAVAQSAFWADRWVMLPNPSYGVVGARDLRSCLARRRAAGSEAQAVEGVLRRGLPASRRVDAVSRPLGRQGQRRQEGCRNVLNVIE